MSRDTPPVLESHDLVVEFDTPDGRLRAVDGVGLEVRAGETLGIVGESGGGKSTLARALLRLVPAASGRVAWLGRDPAMLDRESLRRARRDLQMVFQDPLASFDPRLRIGESIAEPLLAHEPTLDAAAVRERVIAMLDRVGLAGDIAARRPHELSGGQCQRAAIARAMILRPRVVVCDEPVSALDVSVQGHVLNLLREFQREHGTALVFVSHNLAVVRRLCDRVLVLYLGRTMEVAASAALQARPLHPYTRQLLAAVPVADPRVERSRPPGPIGEVPSPLAPPSGCVFRTRCRHATEICGRDRPVLEQVDPSGGRVACHHWRRWPDGVPP